MLALITGASSGIGLNYATELAKTHHADLLLVSNQEQELELVAADLSERFGVKTIPLFRNLATPTAAEDLHSYCIENNLVVDVLINNAGIFFFDELAKVDIKRIDLMLSLHVVTVTKMCRLFGADMKERRHGFILNMSSMSAWMSMPGINVYNATKSYILNLSRSLWYELKPYNVIVTAICPGAIDTGLYGLRPNLRKLAVAIHVSMPPEKLVKKALKALFKGKKQAVPGAINHLFIPVIKHLPDWLVFVIMKKLKPFRKEK